MAQVIDITEAISKRRLDKVKAELEVELERLDYDMEKELNRYVIFDTSGYYELAQEEKEVVSHDSVMKLLLTARDMLVELNEADAAIEVVDRKLRPGDGGVICVDHTGSIAMVFNSTGMYRGAANADGLFKVAIWDEPVPAPE